MLDELVEEVEGEGLEVVETVGLEGIATSHQESYNELFEEDEKAWKEWWRTHLKTYKRESVAETSEHILVVCWGRMSPSSFPSITP